MSEASNRRGHPIPVVGGLASQPLITSRVKDAQPSELGRLFHLGGAAFLLKWMQWALDHSTFDAFKTSRLEEWEQLRARVESDEFAAEWEAQKGQRKIQEQEARLEMAWLEKGLIAFLALTFAALFSWMMVEKIQDLRSIPDIRGTSTK